MNHEYRLLWQLISTVYSVAAVSVGVATTVYFAISTSLASHAEFHEIFFASLYALGTAAVAYLAWNARQVSRTATLSEQSVAHYGEGFNVYLRIGLVVFLVGSQALTLLRVVAFVVVTATSCSGPRLAAPVMSLLEMLFTASQAAFLLRHHRVVFLRKKAQNRMALAHLFTANVCIWARSAIGEIKEQFEPKAHHKLENETHATGCGAAAVASRLVESAQPYLIPTVIEYCLLCAPMVLHVMACVGDHNSVVPASPSSPSDTTLESNRSVNQFLRRCFAKSRRGLATCLAIVLGTAIVTVTVNLLLDRIVATAVYLVQDLLVSFIGVIICLLIYPRLKRLGLAKSERHSFDDKLLVFALFGTLVYLVTLGCVLVDHSETLPSSYLAAELTIQVVCSLQQVLQTVCILDGLRRKADTYPAALAKPGRGHVLALLGVNLSLWIMETFEVRKAEETLLSYRLDNVSPAALKILIHIGQPVNIFYRFHSTVCLSIIWRRAFEIHQHSHEEAVG